MNLSSEYISLISKKKLRNLAQIEIDNLYDENPNLVHTVGGKRQLIDRWKSRYLRFEKFSLRKKEVTKYFSNKNEYKLPPKL